MGKMLGVLVDLIGCPIGVIIIFIGEIGLHACDAPILQAASSGFFVKFAVVKIAGVAVIGTPDLHSSLVVTPDDDHIRMFLGRSASNCFADEVGFIGGGGTLRN